MSGASMERVEQRDDETRDAVDALDLRELMRLIATLCFPNETASVRLRQIAFLALIDLEHQRGEKPTARSLSRLLDGPPSQMDSLAKSLEVKGVLERVLTPALTKGKPGKVLHIRKEATAALRTHYQRLANLS